MKKLLFILILGTLFSTNHSPWTYLTGDIKLSIGIDKPSLSLSTQIGAGIYIGPYRLGANLGTSLLQYSYAELQLQTDPLRGIFDQEQIINMGLGIGKIFYDERLHTKINSSLSLSPFIHFNYDFINYKTSLATDPFGENSLAKHNIGASLKMLDVD